MAEEAEVWLFGGPLSPAVRPFFRDLLGVSASRMAKEPAALSAERERLAAEIEGAAVENYRGFLELAKCVDESGALVRLVGSRGEEAGRGMRRFREEAEQVEDGVAEISREQKKNQAMLQSQEVVMDLLEIPELLENCVRGEMFEEALDLKNHVEVIVERHRNLPLLNMILKDMQIAIGKMSDALLQELQAKKIPLTELLKVISYLRRMNLFSEQELRKQFLIRRERWFQNETDKLLLDFQTSKNGYAYLTQLVDFNRLNLFEIITQFRALFVEGADETDQVKAGEGNILHLWVRYRIAELLNALSCHIDTISEGVSLGNLLRQVMSCAFSVGSVGVDFRSLLPSIFEEKILDVFSNQIAKSLADANYMLDGSKWALSNDSLENLGINYHDNEHPLVISPAILKYPPLAVFIDGIISSINELITCCPFSIQGEVRKIISRCLSDFLDSIISFATKAQEKSNSSDTRSQIEELIRAYILILVPCVQRLFEKLFHQRDSLNSSTLKNRAENFIGFGIVDETLVVENPFDAKHENEGNAHEAVGEEEANKISQHETEQSNEGYAQESFPGEDQDGVDAESFENEETSPQS